MLGMQHAWKHVERPGGSHTALDGKKYPYQINLVVHWGGCHPSKVEAHDFPALKPKRFRFSGICLALDADPQRGAKNTARTCSFCSHDHSNPTPSGAHRSATTTGPEAFLLR